MRHTIETRIEVMEAYKNGKDSTQLSAEYGIPQNTITSWLRAAGLTRHRGPKSKVGREDFFSVIDTEEKAYYLGWIMADGNVSIYNGQYSLKLHIAIGDKHMIDNFLKAVQSTNKTKDKDVSYYVSLTSRRMVEDLMTHGVVPNKTGKEYIPETVPSHLMNHFIRGYFDGDGITDSGRQFRSGFIGSERMMNDIQKVLGTDLTVYKVKGAYSFMGGAQFTDDLAEYLYSDATVWLQRKRDAIERMEVIPR